MDSNAIIDAILNQDADAVKNAFNDAISAKISDALDIKKVELASTLVNPEENVDDTDEVETETDGSDQTDADN